MAPNSEHSDIATQANMYAMSSNAVLSDDVTYEDKHTEFEALLKLGSQELPNANSNLLKNSIHPILEKRNWQSSARDAWLPLQPALRLASKLIGEEEMLAFWSHLVWGREKMEQASDEFGYDLDQFSAEGPPLNETQKRQVSCWLRDFGGNREICPIFSFQVVREGPNAGRLGRCGRVAGGILVVELRLELLDLLREHHSGREVLSETQLLRVNLLTATTLLHEFAHAVFKSLSRSIYEPYYGNHVVAELGHAWGCWAFGGGITPIHPFRMEKPAHIGGFWVPTPPSPWRKGSRSIYCPENPPLQPLLGDPSEEETFWILAMEHIQRLQTEEFWDIEIKARGVRALHVPPTDGDHNGQHSLDNNWRASVTMTRGENDRMLLDAWSSKMARNPEFEKS